MVYCLRRLAAEMPNNPGPDPTTTLRDQESIRTLLVREATLLFGTLGFRRATVRGICAAAGVYPASIRYHFGSKEGLYDATMEEAAAVVQETIRKSIRGCGPEDRIEGLLRCAHTLSAEYPSIVRLALQSLTFDHDCSPASQLPARIFADRVKSAVEDAQRQALLPDGPTEVFASIILTQAMILAISHSDF